jgi:prevent-host-death family protein
MDGASEAPVRAQLGFALTMVHDHSTFSVMSERNERESIAISEFKATCLAVLERVRRTGRSVIVTRRGEPIAEIGPPTPPPPPRDWLGDLREHGRIVGDVVGPTGESDEWEVIGE